MVRRVLKVVISVVLTAVLAGCGLGSERDREISTGSSTPRRNTTTTTGGNISTDSSVTTAPPTTSAPPPSRTLPTPGQATTTRPDEPGGPPGDTSGSGAPAGGPDSTTAGTGGTPGGGGGEPTPGTGPSVPSPTTTASPPPPSTAPRAVGGPGPTTALVEAAAIGGIALGSSTDEAIAAFGQPSEQGELAGESGRTLYMRWDFDGTRGVTLNYRDGSVHTPGLTDWKVNTAGPQSDSGIQVGDPSEAVEAAYGPLAPSGVAGHRSAGRSRAGGRIEVFVNIASNQVAFILGGDQAAWSLSPSG